MGEPDGVPGLVYGNRQQSGVTQRSARGRVQGKGNGGAANPAELIPGQVGLPRPIDIETIGLVVEHAFGSQASLVVFLALYFLFLWVSWLLAVRLTEPKVDAQARATSGSQTP